MYGFVRVICGYVHIHNRHLFHRCWKVISPDAVYIDISNLTTVFRNLTLHIACNSLHVISRYFLTGDWGTWHELRWRHIHALWDFTTRKNTLIFFNSRTRPHVNQPRLTGDELNLRCKHWFCQLTRSRSLQTVHFPYLDTRWNKRKVEWVIAWLQADSKAAAG